MSAARRGMLVGARIGILVLLAVMLGYLFHRTQAVDLDEQNRIMLKLRELEKLDAQWDLNVLRSHIGLNADYDPLSAPLPRMARLRADLQLALTLPRTAAAMDIYQELLRAMDEKEALVEQFKSQNAVLRNALSYFPPAVVDLKTEINGFESALAPSRTVLALDAALNTLLTSPTAPSAVSA